MSDLTTDIYYHYLKHIKEELVNSDVRKGGRKYNVISYDNSFKTKEMNNFAHVNVFVVELENFLNKMIRIYRDRSLYNKKDFLKINYLLEHQSQIKEFFDEELNLQDFKIFRRKYICDNI